jgi:soluble lytic murein transglycosylase-like protein
MDGRNLPRSRSLLVSALAALCVSAPAFGQVIEIGPGGVSTFNGPSIVTSEGVSPIVQKTPAPVSGQSSARHAAAAPLLEKAGAQVELSPRLLEAVAYVESRMNPNAVSAKGAQGMMQLMPQTAAELGVDASIPEENVRGGADYLRKMVTMFGNNVELALAAYNAGPSAVLRYGGVPPYAETKAYVAAVMDYLARTSVSETD